MTIDHLAGQLQVSVAQCTDKGLKDNNEDSLGIIIPDEPELTTKGIVAAIADGVSTAEAGKEASEACVKGFLSDYFSTPNSWTVKTSAQKIFTALNRWLYGQGLHHLNAEKGFITTFSVMVIKSRQAHIFHVGDTRIYRFRDQQLEPLTQDHVSRLGPDKQYLARAMGIDLRLDIDYRTVDVQPDDVFLLTTDGIHDYVSTQAITAAISENADLNNVCGELIDTAKRNASPDNLSCQLIRVDRVGHENQDDAFVKLNELPFPPPLSPGLTIDGYLVEHEIHASSRSQLYVVTDTDSGQKWVMKTPSVNFDDDPAYIDRFILEEWIGKGIDSPNVVKVVTPSRQRKFLYYLTEFVPGPTLAQWMADQPEPDIQEVVRIIEALARGMRALHRKEILHQDIKPQNIVIDANGQPKLIDFGSAVSAAIEEIDTPIERDFALGTADYSAPEYRIGSAADTRSELFSLGIIAYEMLAGHHPYGEHFGKCKQSRDFLKLKYQRSYHHNAMVPVWMDGALKKATQINPDARYEDLSEFIWDLKHPNEKLMGEHHIPLVERKPLLMWKTAAIVLLLSQIASLLYIFR